MAARYLLGLAIAFMCITGCEKSITDKQKRDDFIITRKDRVVVRHDGDGALPGGSDIQYQPLPESCVFCVSDGILFISFMDSGVYGLRIENNLGEIVFSSLLPADGNTYEFDVSDVDKADFFAIVLKGVDGDFKGYF